MTTKEKGPRPEKVEEVEFIRKVLEDSTAAIIADYRGLNVKSISILRKRLREANSGIRVVKNTLLKRAAQGLPAEELVKDLEGPTALAYTEADPVDVAKTLTTFARESKILAIKGGVADGHLMNPAQLLAFAALPPRQVLLAQVVGGLQAPLSSLVGTMQRLYADFVYTLQSVADKKE
jgi:large subunit ribosomal protein L10